MKTIIKFTNSYTLSIFTGAFLLSLTANNAFAVPQAPSPIESIQLNELPPPWETPRGSMELNSQSSDSNISYNINNNVNASRALKTPLRPAAPNGPYQRSHASSVTYKKTPSAGQKKIIQPIADRSVHSNSTHHSVKYQINNQPQKVYQPSSAPQQSYTHQPHSTHTQSAEAQYRMGMNYLTGNGVKMNKALANQWLIKAANNGYRDAQFEVFKIYMGLAKNADGVKKALIYLKNAVDQNHIEAQYMLGKLFLEGKFLNPDPHQAQHWLSRAANQGHQQATQLLSQR